MADLAKVGDKHSCPLCGDNTVVEGSSNTLVDGFPVARVGDKTACGATIVTGLGWLNVDNKPVAVLGSVTSHGGVIEASSTAITGTPGGSSISPSDFNLVAFQGMKYAFQQDPARPELDGNKGMHYFGDLDSSGLGFNAAVNNGTIQGEVKKEQEKPKNWVKIQLVDQNEKGLAGEVYVVKDAASGQLLDTGNLDDRGNKHIPLPEHVKQVTVEYPEIQPYNQYDIHLARRPGESDVSYAERIQEQGNKALQIKDPKARILRLEQIHSALLADQGISSPIDTANPTKGDIRWLTYIQGLKPEAWGYPGIPILRRSETLPQKDMAGEDWAIMHSGGASGLYVGPDSHMYDRGEAVRQGLRRDASDNNPQLNQLAYIKKLLAQYGPDAAMQEAQETGNVMGMAAEMGALGGAIGSTRGRGKGDKKGRNSYTRDGISIEGDTKKLIREQVFSYKNNANYALKPSPKNPELNRYQKVGIPPHERLRQQFESHDKKAFIKHWANNSNQAKRILSPLELKLAREDGRLPKRYDVHHMKPLFRGGDNRYDNLRVIQKKVHQDSTKKLHRYENGKNPYRKVLKERGIDPNDSTHNLE
ncbi:PAAR domain-containing protein [Spartinivicinus poritis]|uniref:PAAR domain-containing protein n=1 Tax=Spartinivicinus poritis TaxID=2994640 RepID=A0ABT5UGF1_9GAMM|nr:PAAR domain-containing protein [Spartinivicinus sp. A2-2]MDE1465392.1 PAAR domain-containing protein [Spartinivicinus sp. A2-2]